MEVLIITGGNSSERKISLMSASCVKKALHKRGYQAKLFDFKKGYLELKKIIKDFDVIFPVMHGKEGEDGTLYKFLKKLHIPFVGQNCLGSALAFNKILFKKYCQKNNIPTSSWKIVKNTQDISNFGFPCVLKAAEGGSSKEVVILNSDQDLKLTKVKEILKMDCKLFVEQYLAGTELTIGVLFNQALPVVEIIPPSSGWFDYKNKYSGASQEIVDPSNINPQLKKMVQQIALKIHRDLLLGSYSRTDVIISDGKPWVLETNSPCGVGFTSESLFPKAALGVGISFPDLLDKIIKMS